MEMHVTILRATSEGEPIRGESQCMNSTEMACYLCKCFIINDTLQSNFEASFLGSSRRDFFGVLTPCQEDVELLVVGIEIQWTDRSCPAWLYKVENTCRLEIARIEELSGAVSRACNEHGMIHSHRERENLILMHVLCY